MQTLNITPEEENTGRDYVNSLYSAKVKRQDDRINYGQQINYTSKGQKMSDGAENS